MAPTVWNSDGSLFQKKEKDTAKEPCGSSIGYVDPNFIENGFGSMFFPLMRERGTFMRNVVINIKRM
jgi:hypothetical protein